MLVSYFTLFVYISAQSNAQEVTVNSQANEREDDEI